ncbi:Dolichyl-phosphate-mannose-protein mannosyltransferase-domain-containing protein [Scheffersomyces xylosifermentans]|uniref:Dolichyl-phosphate-mannose-protein mannosyltransferase-domain-containing protein n=1 Tax=Scheffersomyces xylosifermentans TaxID=1304137 RepID=UPI00315C873F
MSSTLRKRGPKKASAGGKESHHEDDDFKKLKEIEVSIYGNRDPEYRYYVGLAIVTILAIYTRFTRISYPDKVVFDEVHFGKFASYYLERTYFFDLHPPFAKLLIAFVGWLRRYDGSFKFDNIGDSYITHKAPYIAYRSLSAIQGTLIVPTLFWTMKVLGFSVPACMFSAIIVCFDNAQVADSRLILLDATLTFSVALTIFSYAKFSTYRRQPFSQKWWTWLTATGISLSIVISTKYVGVFTFVTIGIAVIHELWILLDYKKGLTMTDFAKHFFARFWSLIVLPFIIYLFWFYVHFAILTKSGPGDNFMSSEFQETLIESPMARLSKTVQYNDYITIKHKETGAFLHSHPHVYPLRYEDGRISSNSQQVTCVIDPNNKEVEDPNNQWEIVPEDSTITRGTGVNTNDVVRFRHVGTGGWLQAHDVASPLKATHEEFTIAFGETAVNKYNETRFRLRYAGSGSAKNKNKKRLIKTKATPLRIIHVDTVVAMWTHDDELLPEWGFGQQEVSGNKKTQDEDNIWTIDEIAYLDPNDKRSKYVPKKVQKLSFFKKWWELQFLMFKHNNQLSSEHPFASQPETWPLALSGVSFYNDTPERKQIFFTGNIIGFWLEVCFLSIYLGLLLADQITRRRDIYLLTDKARSRLYNTLGFLFLGWSSHYFPFFLMNRQKFLHHYLPAHLIAALFSGGLVEFITSNNGRNADGRPQGVNKIKLVLVTGVCTVAIVWFFFYFRPITYGDVSLSVEEVKARQWLDIKLHFAK